MGEAIKYRDAGEEYAQVARSLGAASVGGLVLVDNLKNDGRGIQPKLPLSLRPNLTSLFLWPALA